MSKRHCSICDKEVESTRWMFVEGDKICEKHYRSSKPEFVPDRIKEDRRKYFNSAVQPYRDGKLSKEFVEANPRVVKNYPKDKVDNAEYVWKDLPGWHDRKKSL